MILKELKKRILTSIFLIILLTLMFSYIYILIITLIIISLIAWIEFYGLIIKIFKKKNLKNKIMKFFFKFFSLLYIFIFSLLIINIKTQNNELEIFLIYSILVAITSDIGGLIFGKTFKGRKLSSISPNKTVSGAIGSLVFSLILVPILIKYFNEISLINLIVITLLISLTSQLGDLLISLLKRKAKVKDTGDLLPGHGGILDRIDGILFAIPVGLILFILI